MAEPQIYLYDEVVYIDGATQYWSLDDEVYTLVFTRYDVERNEEQEQVIAEPLEEPQVIAEPQVELVLDRQAAIECRERLRLLMSL